MLYFRPRSCLVHTIDHFDSEGWFSYDKVIFLCVLCVCWQKQHATFGARKRRNFSFMFPQVVQKHYLGEVEKQSTF